MPHLNLEYRRGGVRVMRREAGGIGQSIAHPVHGVRRDAPPSVCRTAVRPGTRYGRGFGAVEGHDGHIVGDSLAGCGHRPVDAQRLLVGTGKYGGRRVPVPQQLQGGPICRLAGKSSR